MIKQLRRAQSMLEYIGVSAVFATAGILAFTAANKEIIMYHRGLYNNVGQDTLIRNIIGANNNEPWPNAIEWDPDLVQTEIELDAVGFCQGLGDEEECGSGSGSQGQDVAEDNQG